MVPNGATHTYTSARASLPTAPRPPEEPDDSRGDLLAFFPPLPVLADMCMTHPLGDTYVGAFAGSDGWTALLGELEKRSKYDRSGTGICELSPCCTKHMDVSARMP